MEKLIVRYFTFTPLTPHTMEFWWALLCRILTVPFVLMAIPAGIKQGIVMGMLSLLAAAILLWWSYQLVSLGAAGHRSGRHQA